MEGYSQWITVKFPVSKHLFNRLETIGKGLLVGSAHEQLHVVLWRTHRKPSQKREPEECKDVLCVGGRCS